MTTTKAIRNNAEALGLYLGEPKTWDELFEALRDRLEEAVATGSETAVYTTMILQHVVLSALASLPDETDVRVVLRHAYLSLLPENQNEMLGLGLYPVMAEATSQNATQVSEEFSGRMLN